MSLLGCDMLESIATELDDGEFSAESETIYEDRAAIVGDVAEVVWVIDGDTIDVELNGAEYRVRYIGVDTPERDEPFYEQASAFNRDLVAGQTIILVKDVSDTDQYGRLLRYIYLEDGTFVNRELIAGGYARLVTYPPDVSYADQFRALQGEARSAELGMWGVEFAPTSSNPNAPAGCAICNRNSYNCSDFDSQSEAQACFEHCSAEVGYDVHKLDGGGDGLVCEALP